MTGTASARDLLRWIRVARRLIAARNAQCRKGMAMPYIRQVASSVGEMRAAKIDGGIIHWLFQLGEGKYASATATQLARVNAVFTPWMWAELERLVPSISLGIANSIASNVMRAPEEKRDAAFRRELRRFLDDFSARRQKL